ncbi:unnamed protein product [Ilex paraguariensis]|uniref:U-box domain-containing protein n=1 Tax=Ilex paraguariensis TaxID=185542 RepID=A0ABC8UVC6_9AQUA
MKDPVTAVTGITYDRESIEHWLSTAEDVTCPYTKQPLPRDSELTPNHMLRRLIQAWCIENAKNGIDPIPTPKSPLNKSVVLKLLRELNAPQVHVSTLKKIDAIVNENEKNRKFMEETSGATKAMVLFFIKCFKEGRTEGLEEALRILHLIWSPTNDNKQIVKENFDLVQSIIWILQTDMDNHVTVKIHAVAVLKMVVEYASSCLLERLKPDFFKETVKILQENISQQAVKSVLQVLNEVCPWGRNRIKIVEAGAVFELVEMELQKPDKNITELIFCLLAHLCSCADGRAQLLNHAGGIAMLAKRTLRVSPATDDRAIHILALIAKFSATQEVLSEMLRVGGVAKLCMVIQADCAAYLKKKAREVLRLHSKVWSNSPCIDVYLLTRYPR